ncbi:MAG: CerR family C-terminal domain-containing protein [Acidobacteriota bacterium]|nr:CerR family C-terminal domain-containing protein [Acidobacteriota bacterium]
MTPAQTDLPHDVKLRLIEAATLLFAAKGFDGVGLREIAAKAQANSAMVAYHFGGKEGLYLAVLRAGFERCPSQVAQLSPIPAPSHPLARELALKGIQDHIRAFVDELLMRECDPLMEASSVLVMRELAVGGPFLEELNQEFMLPYFIHLRDCVRALRPDWGETEVLYAMAAIHGSAMIYKFIPAIIKLNSGAAYPPDPADLARFLTDYTLRALAVAPHGA